MKIFYLAPVVAMLALPLPQAARAAVFDGSQPIICAPVEILECERTLHCEAQTVDTVDLPQFLMISIQDKTVTGTRPSGEPVNAKIDQVQHVEQQMHLQGIQKRFGWSAVIDEAQGHMTLMIGDPASGYVIFGACTQR
jgi:hypothetical protein